MAETTFLQEHKDALRARTGMEVPPAVEALLEELWSYRQESQGAISLGTAAAVGAEYAQRAVPRPTMARAVLALGRALSEAGGTAGLLDDSGRRNLCASVEDAVVRALAAYDEARDARLQAWLSFLTHELKNPLNTMLNALWLIREKGTDGGQTTRFLDLADRAVRRMEELIGDVRQLNSKMDQLPPGKQFSDPPNPV